MELRIIFTMKITSSAFDNNSQIPEMYTCDGVNVNPPLIFQDVPEEANSLVLIVDDPDAPGGTWVHWVLYNISPQEMGIGENVVPEGAKEGITSFGKPGYGGPCPPSGTHRYFFKLYALDKEIEGDNLSKKKVEEEMKDHTLASAELVGLYSKS